MTKIYIVGGDLSYSYFINDSEVVYLMDDADLVIFTGGEDVSPSYYQETSHERTWVNVTRDLAESQEWYKARLLGKPMLGICRGAQFLTVMTGGKLVQDVSNHSIVGTHEIVMGIHNEKYRITSTHHQMMNPYMLDIRDYQVLAVSSPSLSSHYYANAKESYHMPDEPEIVYYHKNNSLAIQGHPEQMEPTDHIVMKINQLIKRMIKHGTI